MRRESSNASVAFEFPPASARNQHPHCRLPRLAMRPPNASFGDCAARDQIALLIDYIKLLKNHIALLEINIAAR